MNDNDQREGLAERFAEIISFEAPDERMAAGQIADIVMALVKTEVAKERSLWKSRALG